MFYDGDDDDEHTPYWAIVTVKTAAGIERERWILDVCSHIVDDSEEEEAFVQETIEAMCMALRIRHPERYEWDVVFEPYQNFLLN